MKKLTLLAILVTTITIAQKQDKKLFKVQEKTQQLKGNKCFTTGRKYSNDIPLRKKGTCFLNFIQNKTSKTEIIIVE